MKQGKTNRNKNEEYHTTCLTYYCSVFFVVFFLLLGKLFRVIILFPVNLFWGGCHQNSIITIYLSNQSPIHPFHPFPISLPANSLFIESERSFPPFRFRTDGLELVLLILSDHCGYYMCVCSSIFFILNQSSSFVHGTGWDASRLSGSGSVGICLLSVSHSVSPFL